jgi:hypothetical protein
MQKKVLVKNCLLFAILVCITGSSFAQKKLVLGNKGKTAYSIYIDPAAPLSVRQAAEDLKLYFNKVAGFSPKVIVAAQAPGTPFISLGNNSASNASGINSSGISNDGFTIVVKSRNVFILGPDTKEGEVNHLGGVSNGTANGVYTFIEDYLGVTWLMPGELGEDFRQLSTVAIPARLDRSESSPLNYRVVPIGNVQQPLMQEWNRRMKLGRVAALQHSHAWAETIPPSAFEKHPEWFAVIDGKPVPPAGRYKFETTNAGLVQAYANVIIETFRKNPNQKWYSLSPSDGGGWSESPEATVLLEKDPHGNLSRTKLVLKFYNDVAKIVRKVFPDRKLGGYIYATYLYPPEAGVPKLEPNLALVVATSNSYGYQLYRPSTERDWDKLMRTWGESARKDGFDVYYYDLPTVLVQPYGTILPPAPYILDYTFSRVKEYGFKGAYFSGNNHWITTGAGNFTSAKLEWNPGADAYEILENYFRKAYGPGAASPMQKMYALLDSAYRVFYTGHPKAGYNMTHDHFKEIYGTNYNQLEKYFLQALAIPKEAKQQRRLELFGQIFSLMQWNLKAVGVLPTNLNTSLTLPDEEIDKLVLHQEFSIVPSTNRKVFPGAYKATLSPPLNDAGKRVDQNIPVRGEVTILLHPAKTGEIVITAQEWNGKAELVHYSLYDEEGNRFKAGAMARGRSIKFNGQEGKSYILHIPSRDALFELDIKGAAVAYQSNISDGGFRMLVGSMKEEAIPLYFFVPATVKDFSITLSSRSAKMQIFSPDGRLEGFLDNHDVNASRMVFNSDKGAPGFWKMSIKKFNGTCTVTLDKALPQWVSIDPSLPLRVEHERAGVNKAP